MKKFFSIYLILIVLASCSEKKYKKIELSKEKKNIEKKVKTDTITNNTKNLTPEKFFKISIEINKLSREYNNKISNLPEDKINSMLKQLDNEINNIYLKFNTSESDFNSYSLKHYKELEEYLKKHPDIDTAMRQ